MTDTTIIYFVRHAEPDLSNHDDASRGLTKKGLADRRLVTEFLADRNISAVLSSPFKRAVETVKELADLKGLPVITVDDFRERKVDNIWIEDFNGFCKRQWSDFDYKLHDGESLMEVQRRNIAALQRVLREYAGGSIVIGTHGTALSTIINYYDSSFGYEQFSEIKGLMPWLVCMKFDGIAPVEIIKRNLFEKK